MAQQKVKSFLPVLSLLANKRVKNEVKCALLNCPELVEIISLLALNTLKGRVKISPLQKKRLRPYKKLLKTLATKNVSHKKKRQQLVQSGGSFLATLIPSIIPAIGEIIKLFKG
jgi:hypothetical protein